MYLSPFEIFVWISIIVSITTLVVVPLSIRYLTPDEPKKDK